MTPTNRQADTVGRPPGSQRRQREAGDREHDSDEADTQVSLSADVVEALLRQVVTLRAASAGDDQLAQLIRIVDSATWSAPVPMTIFVDGALLRGILVPSEVSAIFLDDALRRSAHAAVDELEHGQDEMSSGKDDLEAESETTAFALHQARAFLGRVKRRPFNVLQMRIRQRNANAVIAINEWHKTRDRDARLTPLDMPGSYADPMSVVRDVVPYTAGQRALTLADVKVMVAGDWLALAAPVRVAIGRIGAWSVDL